MKTTHIFSIMALLAMMSVSTISCKKSDEQINPNDKNSVVLAFENRVGDKTMTTATTTYKNCSGEDFTITTFNYFISSSHSYRW